MLHHFIFFLTIILITTPAFSKSALIIGDPAPEFVSQDEQGNPISLSQFKGKTVVLYFYPKDGTPGCTAEAKSFRDQFAEFQKRNVVILGISFDDSESHREFKEDENLPFALLATNQHQIAEDYGVGGVIFADRDTIIIAPDGHIKSIMRSVKASDHAKVILEALDS